ncbi:hypothetical protein METBIDRAFT_115199 [Metschnikowia bicuspidata var. bicuspidata NRRL YB-4993]|uniref:Tubulin-specific chaperone A n=1 Tax=Metschnikowia bicuspidata var. bicuspidata NRRL YB-4993 TaxID=869754 RepID=A0A1A0HIU2_9ASCO|nr:hypothetical protein METBIDRAFT_115199 [Metschnikowia bicuspidata var. bicuspidata NRRL YB-4993]OBA23930.1 hypothetical protein METBIDRAFT_115199 [Metschnikowia bicuspidata var. bicuspidata NRRL YB-4993]
MPPSQLQIQTRALERLKKEKALYFKELEAELKILGEMESCMADAYDIKKQHEITSESKRMIDELNKRIAEYRTKLADFVAKYNGEENLDVAKALLTEF